jgi:hypothetical protein
VLQAAAEVAALMGGVGCAAMDWAALCGASPSTSLLPAVTTWLRGGGDVAAGAWEAPLALQKLAAAHAAHRVLPVRVAALMARLERPAHTFTRLLEVLQCPPPAPLHHLELTMHDCGGCASDSSGSLDGLLAEGVAVAAAQVNTPVASISLCVRALSVSREKPLALPRSHQFSTGAYHGHGSAIPCSSTQAADETLPLGSIHGLAHCPTTQTARRVSHLPLPLLTAAGRGG